MNTLKWLKIICKIISLIIGGMSTSQAVSSAANIFNITEKEIWEHGGF